MTPMTTDFKPRFKWETFRHDKWTYLFCHGGPTADACPMFEYRKPAEWHMASDFCKATGASIYYEDVEMMCPRSEELSARLHADAVARKKAKAKAKHEYDATHPRVKEPAPKSMTRDEQIAAAIKAWPEDALRDNSELF